MKRLLLPLLPAIMLFPSTLLALDLGVNGTTIVRYEERSVPGFDKKTMVPATQYLGVDVGKAADGHLSFHMYGWGRVDGADQSTPRDSSDTALSYGYLDYQSPKGNAEVKVGRQYLYEGGVVEQLDGISARSDLFQQYEGFALSAFAGKPVKTDRVDDHKGDLLAGGRLSYRVAGVTEMGLFLTHENGAAAYQYDKSTNSATLVKDNREQAGFDVLYTLNRLVELNGRSLYNLSLKEFAEHSYVITVKPVAGLSLSGSYNQHQFKGYFASASNPFLFKPYDADEEASYSGSASYALNTATELTADYTYYDRKTKGTSARLGLGGRFTLLGGKLKTGLDYHRLNSAKGMNSYHEARGFALYDPGRYYASLDAIAQRYDDPLPYLNTSKIAYEITASSGYRLKPWLLLSGDLSAGANPQYGDQVKGLLRLTFAYTTTTGGVGR